MINFISLKLKYYSSKNLIKKGEKDNQRQTGRRYLQHIYLTKDLFPNRLKCYIIIISKPFNNIRESSNRHCIKTEKSNSLKYMKMCSASLLTGEIKIKATKD